MNNAIAAVQKYQLASVPPPAPPVRGQQRSSATKGDLAVHAMPTRLARAGR